MRLRAVPKAIHDYHLVLLPFWLLFCSLDLLRHPIAYWQSIFGSAICCLISKLCASAVCLSGESGKRGARDSTGGIVPPCSSVSSGVNRQGIALVRPPAAFWENHANLGASGFHFLGPFLAVPLSNDPSTVDYVCLEDP